MKPAMKMLAATYRNQNRESRNNEMRAERQPTESRYDMRMRGTYSNMENEYRQPRNAYDMESNYDRMNYEMENRTRDSRGREHYDNGRYAPKSEMRSYSDSEYEERPRNRIGFASNDEMRSDYRMDVEYNRMQEMDYRPGRMEQTHGTGSGVQPLDKRTATEWVQSMKRADKKKGQRWSMEDAERIMKLVNADCDPVEFYAVLNSLYSDYSEALMKYGATHEVIYGELAKAWLEDEDANPGKAALYYKYIVKH